MKPRMRKTTRWIARAGAPRYPWKGDIGEEGYCNEVVERGDRAAVRVTRHPGEPAGISAEFKEKLAGLYAEEIERTFRTNIYSSSPGARRRPPPPPPGKMQNGSLVIIQLRSKADDPSPTAVGLRGNPRVPFTNLPWLGGNCCALRAFG